MNWASSAIITSVASFLMEQGYGCNVVKVPTSTIPALTSAAETGEPEIITEMYPVGSFSCLKSWSNAKTDPGTTIARKKANKGRSW
ncbi:MAG: glycine betaine ABC transporter substrate-binding protein [Mesorhizobium sp.]